MVGKVFSCRLSPQELLAVHTRWGEVQGWCRVTLTVQALLAGHGGLGRLGLLRAGQGGPHSPHRQQGAEYCPQEDRELGDTRASEDTEVGGMQQRLKK